MNALSLTTHVSSSIHLQLHLKWIKIKKIQLWIFLMMKCLTYQRRRKLHCLNSLAGLSRCTAYRDIWREDTILSFIWVLKTEKRRDFRQMVKKTYSMDMNRTVLMKLVNMKKLGSKQWLCKLLLNSTPNCNHSNMSDFS